MFNQVCNKIQNAKDVRLRDDDEMANFDGFSILDCWQMTIDGT